VGGTRGRFKEGKKWKRWGEERRGRIGEKERGRGG